MDTPGETAAAFLRAVRYGEPTKEYESALASADPDALAAALETDGDRLAFWVNVYNAAVQGALADEPERYENKRAFFASDLVTVAGHALSPDEIEHGILRRSYHQYGLGYVRSPFRDEFASAQAVRERDPRIHFALNCGAASCPPIAAYDAAQIDKQLDWATEGYLDQTVTYDPEGGPLPGRGRAVVPRVMLWYRGDFGGRRGIVELLRRYEQIPPDASPWLSYHDWDWSLSRGKFTESEPQTTPESEAPDGATESV